MAVCFFFTAVLLLKHGLLGEAQELIRNPPQQLNIAPTDPNSFIGFSSEVWGDDVVASWNIDGKDLNVNTENQCFRSQPGSEDGVVVAISCTYCCPSIVTLKAQSGVRNDSQTTNVTMQAPPTDLRVINTTNSTILICWIPPLIPTGMYYYYVVYITDVDTGILVKVLITNTDCDNDSLPTTCDECLQHWTSRNLLSASAPNNTFLFKKSSGIDSNHTFRFQVTTGSLAGESERSEAVEGRFQNGTFTPGNPGTTPNEDSNLAAILAPILCIICALLVTGAIIGGLCWHYRPWCRATERSRPDANGSRDNSSEDNPDSKCGQPQSRPSDQLSHPDAPNEDSEEATSEATGRTIGKCAVVSGLTVPRHMCPAKTALERDTFITIEDHGEGNLQLPVRRFPDPDTLPTQAFDSRSEKPPQILIPEPETKPYRTCGETAAIVYAQDNKAVCRPVIDAEPVAKPPVMSAEQ